MTSAIDAYGSARRNYGLPEEGGSICDIGCGIGRAVYRAALLRRWNKCHGVEIYTPRYKLAVQALKR
jgi:tRNA G46 methylase TrmB